MGAGYVNLRGKRKGHQRKVGREEEGSSSNRPELGWKQISKQRRQINVSYDPNMVTALRHGTGWFREVETTVFDPASVFLSTHWWSQKPSLPVLFLWTIKKLPPQPASFYKPLETVTVTVTPHCTQKKRWWRWRGWGGPDPHLWWRLGGWYSWSPATIVICWYSAGSVRI